MNSLSEAPMYIDDTPNISAMELRTKARRLQAEAGLDLVIVDYLQLMSSTNQGENRATEISEISRSLKGMAKELDVPVIALSQLSRAVEQRDDKRPMLSDLRESGSIEQDADMVWFVYREDYYVAAREPKRPVESDEPKVHEQHAAWAAQMESVYGLAELIVAKQRHGATGKVRLRFEAKITKFSDLAEGEYGADYD
jgi:replicative DNA helicase